MSAVVFSARAPQIRLVGQKIRQIRKSRHLTQSDLAARIGITQSDLSRMENGEYKVGLDTLFRILQVFELSMSQFFNEPAAEEPAVAAPPAAPAAREPGSFAEEPELARDWESLPPEARREVREFIAFKRMQNDFRRAALDAAPKPEPAPVLAPLGPLAAGDPVDDDEDESRG
jgi:transcriptional regulator with XRE-family HTH domain